MSGSEDATARVWDLKAGALRQQRAHAGRAHGIVVAADGKTAASFGDDGALVWDTASGVCLGALEVGAALYFPLHDARDSIALSLKESAAMKLQGPCSSMSFGGLRGAGLLSCAL